MTLRIQGLFLSSLLLFSSCGAGGGGFSKFQDSSLTIVDSHLHIFPEGFELPGGAVVSPDQAFDVPKAETALFDAGIGGAFLLSPGYIVVEGDPLRVSKTKAANDALAKAITESSGKFWGFCGIPLYSFEDAAPEIERCARDLHFLGIKIHPTANNVDFTNPGHIATVAAIIAEAGKWDLAVLIDGSSTPTFDFDTARSFIDKTILSNPQTRVIIAHGLMKNHRLLHYIAEHEGNVRHVFTDVSAVAQEILESSSIDPDEFVMSLRALGMDHVMWGSDGPIFKFGDSLTAFRKLPLTESEKVAILGENALNFASSHAGL